MRTPADQPSLFAYHDYRRYLDEHFRWLRASRPGFSLRAFAGACGFSSHSYLSALIRGKRNLTGDGCARMVRGLGLAGTKARYFTLLVQYNQTDDLLAKDALFRKLNRARRNSAYYRLSKKHFDYFDHWYCFALRELVTRAQWEGDYGKLGRMLNPAISAAEARKGVRILQKTGLVKKNPDGTWSQTDTIISTRDIPGHLVRKARGQFIELAGRASEQIEPRFRDLGAATVGLSEKRFRKAADILERARREILALAGEEENMEKVYQVHLYCFPLSERIGPGGFDGRADDPADVPDKDSAT
jgi:uncharacterized protein (TIGR02147 family)